MAQSVIQELEILFSKLETLGDKYLNLQKEKAGLEDELSSLKRTLKEKDESINKLKKEIEFLKISHKLADSPDNIAKARQLIAGFIRNIDTCISMIREE